MSTRTSSDSGRHEVAICVVLGMWIRNFNHCLKQHTRILVTQRTCLGSCRALEGARRHPSSKGRALGGSSNVSCVQNEWSMVLLANPFVNCDSKKFFVRPNLCSLGMCQNWLGAMSPATITGRQFTPNGLLTSASELVWTSIWTFGQASASWQNCYLCTMSSVDAFRSLEVNINRPGQIY